MIDLVRNAADPKQVRNATRKEKDLRTRELDDMRAVLRTVEGRRFVWRLMGWSGFLQNPSHQRGDMTHQNIGRGDAGRFLLSEILEADENAYMAMQTEARRESRSIMAEAEAIRTRTATSDANNGDES
jgi:hypothetical protein